MSEGEEDQLLAECINMAMPTNSGKKHRMRKSSSDGFLKKRSQLPKPVSSASTSTPKSTYLPVRQGGPQGAFMSPKPSPLVARMHTSYPGPIIPNEDDFYGGGDSPRKFATEGTPLNFSRAESPLSDMSFGTEPDTFGSRPDGAVNPVNPLPQPQLKPATPPRNQTATPPRNQDVERTSASFDDVGSDVSSLSGDCEDLLSEVIEAAMPKTASKTNKRQQMLMDRKAEGSDKKDRNRFQSPNFQNMTRPVAPAQPIPQYNPRMPKPQTYVPSGGIPRLYTAAPPAGQPRQHMPPPMAAPQRPARPSESSDTVRTYAVEGTPINFSRAESPLSNMSDLIQGELKQKKNKKCFKEIKN